MSTIVNNDKLNLKLTQYGLNRIAEAVENPSLTLNITKIRLGNGRNEEYYEPSPTQESLEGDLGISLYIYDKTLLEDQETISFHTVISDNIGGFDIREVGLYETVGNEDKLFAISTQQPFVKPTTADNYFINIDYYIFLKSVNFASVYDQIVLDSNYALVTEPNLEELMKTFLFAHGNLINQIGNNSRIIGYNRPTQLYEIINENKKDYSYITLYKTYASLTDIVNPENIFSYWAFDYSRRRSIQDTVVDLGPNQNYLTVSENISRLNHLYNGFMSMFTLDTPHYLQLSSQVPLNLFDSAENTDLPFTMIFAVEPLDSSTTRTLLAKSNYAVPNAHTFEVNELANNSLEVKLFSSSSAYLTFTSQEGVIPNTPHALILTYDPLDQKMTAFINSNKYELEKEETGSYTHMNESPGTLYSYSCDPIFRIYADSATEPTTLYNADGTAYITSSSSDWQISDNTITYKGLSSSYKSSYNITLPLYKWEYNDTVNTYVIYTATEDLDEEGEDTPLYNENYEVQTNTPFQILPVGDTYGVFYNEHAASRGTPDISKIFYCYQADVGTQYIWTNSTTAPVLLYTQDAQIYTGTDWAIVSNQIKYLGQASSRNSSADMQTFIPDLTSYITNSQGEPTQYINSNVGLISIIKEKLSDENARIMALNLCATMGRNPYLSGS